MADVETGIGPFVSTYLSAVHHFNPAQIGFVLGAQSIATIAAQTPAGWLIDHIRPKKWLIAGAALVISIGAVLIVAISSTAGQVANQISIGIAAAFVSPTIAALSLGLVGRPAFSRRVGRNSAFSHAGNVTTALFAGFLGYTAGQQWIFYASSGFGAAVIATIFFVRNRDVAFEDKPANSGPINLRSTGIATFALIVVVFHAANAAMLPLAGQELARAVKGASSTYMSACIVTAQLVMVPVAYFTGRLADRIGRKPIFLVGFAVLALRGILFAMGSKPAYIVGVEALDGIGTAIASVLAVLVVSDRARGTGRFNLMLGFVQAGVGVGAFLGNSVAGLVARSAGFPVAFAMLASMAVIGFVLYALVMPETRSAA